MIRTLGKWLGRGLVVVLVPILLLIAPVIWVEAACRGPIVADTHTPLLPPEDQRAESRTLLTYPEWHIVHAYDDYARVISTDDPHDFGYFRAIRGFWSALCPLSRAAGAHGGATRETKMTLYTIGVSFTAELALKAAYEETIGRLATMVRGTSRAPLDDLSARQAAEYATFMQQTPWYKWHFRADAAALNAAATDAFRDRERAVALGIEYRTKAAYAGAIEAAVANVGADTLTIRSVVTGLSDADLQDVDGITVIGHIAQGTVIETPRYRTFTHILRDLANRGAEIVEIAGNDDILLTTLSQAPGSATLFSFSRQGYGDWRNLRLVKVNELAEVLRAMSDGTERLEHVHDY